MKTCSKYRHQRRRALKVLLGAGLFSTFAPLLAGSTPFERQLLILAKSLSQNSSVQRLGNTYNRAHPSEAKTIHLVHLLEKSSLDCGKGNINKIEQMLDFAIRHDFDQDRIERIDDWWLSRTEARLYALSALLV